MKTIKYLIFYFLFFGCKQAIITDLDSGFKGNKNDLGDDFIDVPRLNLTQVYGDYDTYYSNQGGVDIYIENHDVYAASLTTVIDRPMGGIRHHLTFFYKLSGDDNFKSRIIFNNRDSLFKVKQEGEKNFIRIIKNVNGVHIYFIDSNKNLLYFSSGDDFSNATVVAENVSSFEVKKDHRDDIKIVYVTGYDFPKIYIQASNKEPMLVEGNEGRAYSYNGSSVNFDIVGDYDVISIKLYSKVDSTNNLYLYLRGYEQEEFLISRGVTDGGQFNQQIKDDKVYTCYKNFLNEFYTASFDLNTKISITKKINKDYKFGEENCAYYGPERLIFAMYSNIQFGIFNFFVTDISSNSINKFDFIDQVSIYRILYVKDKMLILGHSRFKKRMVMFELLFEG